MKINFTQRLSFIIRLYSKHFRTAAVNPAYLAVRAGRRQPLAVNRIKSICFLTFLFGNIAFAQPEDYHGCHYYKSRIPMFPLTEAEQAALNESNARSDTIDILNYDITLDATDFAGQTIAATCEILFTPKMDGITSMPPLDLLELEVDSVEGFGGLLNFDFDGLFLTVHFPQTMNIGDTAAFTVHYRGHPVPDPSGFGGFVFEGDIAYNLGIGLGSNPYNYGRGWFPCFDNFVEHSTFDLNIISPPGKKAYCIGTFLEEIDLGDGNNLRRYRMNQPLPTYLVGVAVGPYSVVQNIHSGAYEDIPITLIGKPGDTASVKNSFEQLGNAIDALESWFGPYAWERVGYVMTNAGAMEHCTSIAYPVSIGTNGPTPNQNRLMAHELAHHWWGNVTTLSSPSNMWIKEGNAEYSAHLFTEYAFGREYFLDVVKDNHLQDVLLKAHIDDDGFHPLSGIPYEHTYGTHTYRKGASVMHNLRGYLGDELFSQGMTSILQNFEYESVDAEQFRDHLTAATGIDLTSFFDDWIFAPGFANYEINNIEITQISTEYKVEVEIEQKLRAAPHFHTNVPLEITFFDQAWNTQTKRFMVSGEFSTASFSVPFEPVLSVLNDANTLNLARTQNRLSAYEKGDLETAYTDFLNLEIIEMEAGDSALINVVHHWTAPDDDPDVNPFELKMSSTHYWTFSGILPENFKAKGTVRYRGGSATSFDYDLTQNTEDSLILVWREHPWEAWDEYPFYRKQTFGSTDGNGFIRIDTLLMGEYAFANGEFPVATEEVFHLPDLNVYPNPSDGILYIEGKIQEPVEEAFIEFFDLTGKRIKTENIYPNGLRVNVLLDLENLSGGSYLLKFRENDGTEIAKPKKVMILN